MITEIISDDPEIAKKLNKYKDQLIRNDDKYIFYKKNSENIWVPYIEYWARNDLFNYIYK